MGEDTTLQPERRSDGGESRDDANPGAPRRQSGPERWIAIAAVAAVAIIVAVVVLLTMRDTSGGLGDTDQPDPAGQDDPAETDDVQDVDPGADPDEDEDAEPVEAPPPSDAPIDTIAGTGEPGFSGDGGPATDAQLQEPMGIATHPDGRVLFSDAVNNRIRAIDPDGTITTVAGTGDAGFSGDGGPATDAQLALPFGVAVDADGRILFADRDNNRIRAIDADGTITTVAGSGEEGFSGDDGPAIEAQFTLPTGVAAHPDGGIVVADAGNHRVRMIDPDGTITTIAGSGIDGSDMDRDPADMNMGGTVPALAADLSFPHDVVVHPDGRILIADMFNDQVRAIEENGTLTVVAGTGVPGVDGDGGLAVQADLAGPFGITVHPDGRILTADAFGHRVREIHPNGTITTLAGVGIFDIRMSPETFEGFSGDGGPAADAQLASPFGVAVDAEGRVLVTDRNNHRIRAIG